MWIVSMEPKEIKKLSHIYGQNFFPRTFYYKKEANRMQKELKINWDAHSIVSKKV